MKNLLVKRAAEGEGTLKPTRGKPLEWVLVYFD